MRSHPAVRVPKAPRWVDESVEGQQLSRQSCGGSDPAGNTRIMLTVVGTHAIADRLSEQSGGPLLTFRLGRSARVEKVPEGLRYEADIPSTLLGPSNPT